MMNDILNKIKSYFFKGKIYVIRTSSYISLLNTMMISFLFMVELKNREIIHFELDKYFIPIILIGGLCLLFIGWFEINVLGGQQKETALNFHLNPELSDMKRKIDYLYNKEVEA